METFLLILAVVFGILQITLFFKIWSMTNRVSDIHKIMSGTETVNPEWGYEEVEWYCERKLKQAKRLRAIGEEGADKILKAMIYDIDQAFPPYSRIQYLSNKTVKYLEQAKQMLEEK